MYVYGESAYKEMFTSYHVVKNERDFKIFKFDPPMSNYSVTDNGLTGDEVSLFMVFGCPTTIKGFNI